MVIRPATLDDVDFIVRVTNLAYLVERDFIHGDRTSADEVRALMAGGTVFLLAEGDGSVLVKVRGERGYFGMLSVDPARQGHGIGRELVAAAEAHARVAGCRFMDLLVVDFRSDTLVPWYQRLGYTVGGTRPISDPEHLEQPVTLIEMSKPLLVAP